MRHELIGFLGCGVQAERMIDVLLYRERHVGIRAIDRTGGCIHQVLDAVVAACFKDVQKTRHVAVDINMRIFDGIAHARLGGEVDHAAKLLASE